MPRFLNRDIFNTSCLSFPLVIAFVFAFFTFRLKFLGCWKLAGLAFF